MPLMFCERLKQARLDRGWTQRELGSRCDIPNTDISHYETGDRLPSYDKLVVLIEALGVKAKVLLGTTR